MGLLKRYIYMYIKIIRLFKEYNFRKKIKSKEY